MFSLFSTSKKTARIRSPLFFLNTLKGEKEQFGLARGTEVRMYNCGPTAYDYQHIGNLRPYVFADILRRTLIANGFSVDQVINITDVGHLVGDGDLGEDKVEKGARGSGETIDEIVSRVTAAFFQDLDLLHVD